MAELIGEPEWGTQDGPRVLVEAADWSSRHTMEQVLANAGYRTVSCPGPSGAGARCSLAAGEGCDAAEQADVVVHALHPGDQRNAEALAALRRRLGGTPVIVEVPEPTARARPDRYEGCLVVPALMTPTMLLTAVSQVVGRT